MKRLVLALLVVSLGLCSCNAASTIPHEDITNQTIPSIPEKIVWKSETGDRYHSINNCGSMNPEKATQVTLEEATREGLTPCENCDPSS